MSNSHPRLCFSVLVLVAVATTTALASNYQCPANLGIFGDYTDNSYYWICVNFVPFRQRCPEPLQFDGSYKQCKLGSNYVLAPYRTTPPWWRPTRDPTYGSTARPWTSRYDTTPRYWTGNYWTSRSPGYRTSRYPTSGLRTSRYPTSGYRTSRSPGYRTSRYPTSGLRTSRYPTSGLRTSRYPTSGYRTSRSPGYRTSRSPGYRTSRFPGYRTSKYPTSGLRTSQYPTSGYRTSRSPGYRTSRNPTPGSWTSSYSTSRYWDNDATSPRAWTTGDNEGWEVERASTDEPFSQSRTSNERRSKDRD